MSKITAKTASGEEIFAEYESIFQKITDIIYQENPKEKDLLNTFQKEFKSLSKLTDTYLQNAIGEGWGLVEEQDREVIKNLKENVFMFSKFKTYETLKQASLLLLDENNNIKDFNTFKKDILQLNKDYNQHYLKSEYNHAIASSQMASTWQSIQENQDDYDLQYESINDQRTRPTHAQLNGIIKPINDAFWDIYYPPNAWNCRCSVRLVRKGTKSKDLPKDFVANGEELPAMFRTNTAKDGVIFPKNHPYFQQNEQVKESIEKSVR